MATTREHARKAFDTVATAVETHAGVKVHLGKTQCWAKGGGDPPRGIAALNVPSEEPVWKGNLPRHKRGMTVLGTPLGSEAFVQEKGKKRLQEEQQLLDTLPQLPDLQCAWLLLYFSGVPRANHLLRAVPPSLIKGYAKDHDDAVWKTLLALLKEDAATTLDKHKQKGQLPCRLGGCGLRCAQRTRPAAYWAAWADALPTLRQRFPTLTAAYVAELETGCTGRQCLTEVLSSAQTLQREGFVPPGYVALAEGAKPEGPAQEEVDPGEWRHGWQYHASTIRGEFHLKNRVEPASNKAEQALLKSQAGRNCIRVLIAVPSDASTTLTPARLATALRRRLRLPLLCVRSRCEGCGQKLDKLGDHLSSCMRSGRVQARAKPPERAWARVLREAGASVHEQHLLRNTTLPVDPTDQRRMDLVVTGLPFYNGRLLFCDVTVRSPLTGKGKPHPKAAAQAGAVLARAEKDKLKKYGDVAASPLGELLVLGCETGGRWNDTAVELVRKLAKNKVKMVHPLLRRSSELAWCDRWWAMLGVSVQDAYTASLLVHSGRGLVLGDTAAGAPSLDEVLDGQRWALEQ